MGSSLDTCSIKIKVERAGRIHLWQFLYDFRVTEAPDDQLKDVSSWCFESFMNILQIIFVL